MERDEEWGAAGGTGRGVEYRVFGPPGTGKTTYLARQIALAAERVGPGRVLVASYTRAAAAELVRRKTGIPRDRLGTLHALAYRALDRPPLVVEKIAEWNTAHPAYALSVEDDTTVLDEPWMRPDTAADGGGDALFCEYQRLRALCVPRERWPLDVQDFARRWEDWKASYAVALHDFTDLIELARDYLPEAPGQPRVGFFDEVQDFSPLELGLVRSWAARMEYVILAGDDDQAIYTFKGADPRAFMTPPLPGHQVRVLAQSHRVPRAVHRLAERWVRTIGIRYPKEYLPRPVDGRVDGCDATIARPEALIDDLEAVVAADKTAMVLTSCGYQLQRIVAALRAAALPFYNPYRRGMREWNPLHATRGVSGRERLLAYLRPDPRIWGREARPWTGADVALWLPLLRAEGVLVRGGKQGLANLAEQAGQDRPLSRADLERYVRPEAVGPLWERRLEFFRAHLTAQADRSLAYSLRIAQRRGGHVLRKEPCIVVGTVHSVKGGEADVVYLFPDLSPSGWRAWGHGVGDGADAVRRMLYVGMTRARERLVLCRGATPEHVDVV